MLSRRVFRTPLAIVVLVLTGLNGGCKRDTPAPAPTTPPVSASPPADTPVQPGAEATPADVLKPVDPNVETVAPQPPLLPPGDCSTTLQAGDTPRYSTTQIDVPSACPKFTINLQHTGRMPRWIMGHNVVLAKVSEVDAVERAGIGAGPYRSYVEPSDRRVLAKTKLAGGGQSVSLNFETSKLTTGHYAFFCTFPGHHKEMQGTLVLR